MVRTTRRGALRALGAASFLGTIGLAQAGGGDRREATDEQLVKLGHSRLSDPPGGYAEEDIREDGRYGVVGSYLGRGGSFLVDLSDLSNPTEVHRLPSGEDTRNNDVKFDPRDGIYYRSQESTGGTGEEGVEVIDYGYAEGSPEDPVVVADLDNGGTHNVFPHQERPLLYAVNSSSGTPGLDVIDVSDPAEAQVIGQAGPQGGLHDVVLDAERDLLHLAYIGANEDGFAGYAILDASDPVEPSFVGGFDYRGTKDYEEVGEEGFENCHYATFDPRRKLAYVGDEVGTDVPGGKHVFDIGFDEGSLQNPVPVGFTHSPRAERQEEPDELFDWTTHNHSIISRPHQTLMVSGDYHEGTVLYEVSEPHNPEPIDWYDTDDEAAMARPPFFPTGPPPMAWGANYNERRDFVFTSDMYTGVYTFRVEPTAPGRSAKGSP